MCCVVLLIMLVELLFFLPGSQLNLSHGLQSKWKQWHSFQCTRTLNSIETCTFDLTSKHILLLNYWQRNKVNQSETHSAKKDNSRAQTKKFLATSVNKSSAETHSIGTALWSCYYSSWEAVLKQNRCKTINFTQSFAHSVHVLDLVTTQPPGFITRLLS